MRIAHALWALALLALGSAPVAATDLSKIDRTIGKQPAYKSKPKYCLLVFGPEAKTRVWLVLDGDTLYADRNGNGDLTAEGARFVAAQGRWMNSSKARMWRVGDIAMPGGKGTYTELTVADISEVHSQFDCRGLGVTVKVPIGSTRAFQSAGSLVHPTHGSSLRFGDRPENAPVIHFAGPMRIMLLQPQRFTGGIQAGQRHELEARVGTPGLGKDDAAIFDDLHLFSFVSADHGTVADWEFTDRLGQKQRLRQQLVCD